MGGGSGVGGGLVGDDFDGALVAAGLGEVVGGLEAEPVSGVGPAGFFEADGHFGGDAGLAVEEAGERVAGDAEDGGGIGDGEAEGGEAGVFDPSASRRSST